MNRPLAVASLITLLTGCAGHQPMQTVDYVDVERFMGDWYVVANIPTFLEKAAFNAVESYRLEDDGSVAATFSFNAGGFDGERKTYHPRGYIKDASTNALWGMQFVWPIKADYRIVYLDEGYQFTVVAREARDYVWVMSRSPVLSDQEFDRYRAFIGDLGYDVAKLQRVPQRWP